MILYPPDHFDENEWFILLALACNILGFVLLPKRLPKPLVPLIALLSMSFPKILDHTIGVKPYDFYNINDSTKYEYFDILLYGVYPLFGYLFLYLYDLWKPKQYWFAVYMGSWSFFGAAIEYILVKLHVFIYTKWNLIYSLPVYLAVLILTFLFYKFTLTQIKTVDKGH